MWFGATIAASALGQAVPIDVERFRPAIDRFGYALTESASTYRHLQAGFSAWGFWAEDSAVRTGPDGLPLLGPPPQFPDAWLDQRTAGVVQAGFGVGNRLSLVVSGPAVVWQEGFEPTPGGGSVDPQASGLGDLRISTKVTFLEARRGAPVGLALLATGSVPTGALRSGIGEGEGTIAPMAIVEIADGDLAAGDYQTRAAVNVGARFKRWDSFDGLDFGNEILFRAALAAKPAEVLELGVDVAGAIAGPDERQNPVELLPWARVGGPKIATLTVGVGIGLTDGLGAPDFRVFVGANIAPRLDPAQLDRDGDGIPNRDDACFADPEDPDGFRDEDGCPDPDNDGDGIVDGADACTDDPEDRDEFADDDGCPEADNDGDAVLDALDRCPDVPEDRDGFQDNDGCPDLDNDSDRILDRVDRCPMAAETVNGIADTDGCPEDVVDTDGDGLHDGVDACPYGAEDFDAFEDTNGCPDPDNDRDGVLDAVDQCPNEPEDANGRDDEDGCPDRALVVEIEREKIVIRERVYFEYNQAAIQRVSFELLDEVARVIERHPELALVRVEGHTDSDGPEAYNLRLSQARAEAVVDYLVSAGVERERLTAQGFGEGAPLVPNDDAEGKARNRRVEFTILTPSPVE